MMLRTETKISKVFDENIGNIFTPNRTSFNESKPSLPECQKYYEFFNRNLVHLHQDNDRPVDDEEEAVQIGGDILRCLIRLHVTFHHSR